MLQRWNSDFTQKRKFLKKMSTEYEVWKEEGLVKTLFFFLKSWDLNKARRFVFTIGANLACCVNVCFRALSLVLEFKPLFSVQETIPSLKNSRLDSRKQGRPDCPKI